MDFSNLTDISFDIPQREALLMSPPNFGNPEKITQIVVIGNGFDLEAKLASSYESFYKSKYTTTYRESLEDLENPNLPDKYTVWDLILIKKMRVKNILIGRE